MTPRQPQSDTPRVSDIGTEAEWRVRGACELGINPYQPGKETDFRDDVRVVLEELNQSRAALQASLQRVAELEAVIRSLEPTIAYAMAHTWTADDIASFKARLREGVRST